MSDTMATLTTDLLEELEGLKFELLTGAYPEDTLSEYVDSAVPIYNGELTDLLGSDPHLAFTDTQGLCGDDADMFARIGIAVYCELSDAAHAWLNDAEFTADDCELGDDGTLDTVILVCGEPQRYDVEATADYRDDDGALDFERFVDDVVLTDLN